jgi:hypothetical protein
MTAALPWIAALAIVPMSALAQSAPTAEAPREIALDIDSDGKMDRAVLARRPGGDGADLRIYLAVGDGKVEPSRPFDFLKQDLAHGALVDLASNGKGSLIVKYGCGGCSNDDLTTLTIVHRGGEFLVAGLTYDWDTRNEGIGGCDINFLTGKGVTSRGLEGKSKPIRAKFRAVKLADWSDEKRPKVCNF